MHYSLLLTFSILLRNEDKYLRETAIRTKHITTKNKTPINIYINVIKEIEGIKSHMSKDIIALLETIFNVFFQSLVFSFNS